MLPPLELGLFILLVAGIIALPGLDMAYILGHSLVGGRRAGMLAVGGVMFGGAVHVVMATLGIGIVVKLVPGLFTALLWLGAAYMAWIGWDLLRSQALSLPGTSTEAQPRWTIVRRGAVSCLLNPKAYLFMLAVFPQFIRAEHGPVWSQAVELGLVIVLCQFAIYGMVACAAGGAQGLLARSPAWSRQVARGVGVLMVGVALLTAGEGVARLT